MNIKKQIGHQGDVQWYSIDTIPINAKKCDKQFIAASEVSGNVHALSGNYDMYTVEDGFIIKCKDTCILNHTSNELAQKAWTNPEILPKRDHRHSVIEKGLYFVGIQRRFDPLTAIFKKVLD